MNDNTPIPNPSPSTPSDPFPIARYRVTVRKISDKGTIKEGLTQTHPIYTGYELKGIVNFLPIAGERWVVARYERNGEEVLGIFTTSVVQAVWHDENARQVRFDTANSQYFVEYTLDTFPSKGVE